MDFGSRTLVGIEDMAGDGLMRTDAELLPQTLCVIPLKRH